ncbi:Glycoside hydrolase, family 35 [Corchorus capsularis]|uniref:Glycoside hydrolase, family 35 n=1 Tax=Corchorus capsularis TaxID=210143 RepID=A0A1R3K4M8_COCAP|nr:Glycoside hydrolase, family 35 [Corchorus capsularis]
MDLQQDGHYFVPAWSVTVLGGCNKEIYNTAKVKTQTSIMEMKQADNEDYNAPSQLSWMWTFEPMKDTLQGRGQFSAARLLEQKRATSDASDYLWYMTSFDNKIGSSWNNLTLYANTTGEVVLHAYVNGKLIGFEQGNQRFERPVSLVPGRNNITLLSATVGLANYGAFFDTYSNGVTGPVGVDG